MLYFEKYLTIFIIYCKDFNGIQLWCVRTSDKSGVLGNTETNCFMFTCCSNVGICRQVRRHRLRIDTKFKINKRSKNVDPRVDLEESLSIIYMLNIHNK